MVRSGSEVNLALAWRLVHPSVSLLGLNAYSMESPGAAAIRSGHLRLLPWLAQHGCVGLPHDTLAAALERCSLPEAQRVWELLGCDVKPYGGVSKYDQWDLAEAAARWAGPDAAKISWLLSVMLGSATQPHTHGIVGIAGVGAAASGNLPLLRWLWDQQGLDVMLTGGTDPSLFSGHNSTLCERVLVSALQHDHVAVAEWLVDEVGCRLPLEQEQRREQELVWEAAGGGGQQAARWLLDRGVPVHAEGLPSVARTGKLETVGLLHEVHGVPLTQRVFCAVTGSGSVPTAAWLLQAGCPVGQGAYVEAASAGDAAMLRWLAREAGCPWDTSTLTNVIGHWPSAAGSMDLLEATVRELVAAGCPPGGGTDDADSLGHAACNGHLALARYLHEELGVGFAPGTLVRAAQGGCEPVIEWIVGAGCAPGNHESSGPYIEAGRVGDVDTLACLRRLGVPWGADVLARAPRTELPLPAMHALAGGAGSAVGWRRCTACHVEGAQQGVQRHSWLVQGAPCEQATGRGQCSRAGRGRLVRSSWQASGIQWFAVLAGIFVALAAVVYARWAAL